MIKKEDKVLIKKFLRNQLTAEETDSFKRKMKIDPAFVKEVEFNMALFKALRTIDNEDLRKKLNIAVENTDKKINANKRTTTVYIYSIVSIAAVFLALIVIFNPFSDRKEIQKYLALADNPYQVEIKYFPTFYTGDRTIDSTKTDAIFSVIKIAKVSDKKLLNKYFIKDKVLYTFFDTFHKPKVFVQLDTEGQGAYYLCKGIRMFKFIEEEEDRILKFELVSDTAILKFCQ